MLLRLQTALLLPVVLAVGCQKTHADSSSTKNIFGTDDRVEMTSTEAPWSSVGKLIQADGSWCTATLVARNIILTAAHCVLDDSGNWALDNLTFYPNFQHGNANTSTTVAQASVGSQTPDANRDQDWAVATLTDAVGDTYGWPAVIYTDTSAFPTGQLELAGYSNDFDSGDTAGVDSNCHERNVVGGLIYDDCNMARGASGGPVFLVGDDGTLSVAGINVAEFRDGGDASETLPAYEDAHANIAIPTKDALVKINELLGNSH